MSVELKDVVELLKLIDERNFTEGRKIGEFSVKCSERVRLYDDDPEGFIGVILSHPDGEITVKCDIDSYGNPDGFRASLGSPKTKITVDWES